MRGATIGLDERDRDLVPFVAEKTLPTVLHQEGGC